MYNNINIYTGNRGSFLSDNDISVYISRDGGLTWNQVKLFWMYMYYMYVRIRIGELGLKEAWKQVEIIVVCYPKKIIIEEFLISKISSLKFCNTW